jgi:hypothetical protein
MCLLLEDVQSVRDLVYRPQLLYLSQKLSIWLLLKLAKKLYDLKVCILNSVGLILV